MTEPIARPYLICPLELSGYVLMSEDGKRHLHACTDLEDVLRMIRHLYSPHPDSLSSDGTPPTGGFPRVVSNNDDAAEPTRRKGWIR